MNLPSLTAKQILGWADAHFRRTGRWPKPSSGPIEDAPGETWYAVHRALTRGRRGLPGGSSVFQFLVKYRRISRLAPKIND
jgi:hypothetical protein